MKPKREFAFAVMLCLASLACNLQAFPVAQPTSLAENPSLQATPTGSMAQEEEAPAQGEPGTLEAIYIEQPGSGSSVRSPIQVKGDADSTFEQNLVLTITDEAGEVLVQQPTTILTPLGIRGPFQEDLFFSVDHTQAGRISVFSLSAIDGGVEHLASVEVRLLPSGEAQVLGPGQMQESIRIDTPAMSAEVSGGVLLVSGFSDYYFEGSLGIALCGLVGSGAPDPVCGTVDNYLAVGSASIEAADIGQPGPFSGELDYEANSPTMARLVIYAVSPRDGGLLHAASVVVHLLP